MDKEANKTKYEHKVYAKGSCMFETTGNDEKDEKIAIKLMSTIEKRSNAIKKSMIKILEQN